MRIGSAGWLVLSGTLSGVLGCGDPLPPPARLAMNIELSSCGVDNLYSMPEDPAVKSTLQNNISEGLLQQLPRFVDGEDGASVSCTVVESSPNTFTFSASASVGASRRFTISSGTTAGPANGQEGQGTATISFLHPNSIPARTGNNCVISTAVAPAGGGALLLEFNCSAPGSTFANPSLDTPDCSASGTVVIDRCSK